MLKIYQELFFRASKVQQKSKVEVIYFIFFQLAKLAALKKEVS